MTHPDRYAAPAMPVTLRLKRYAHAILNCALILCAPCALAQSAPHTVPFTHTPQVHPAPAQPANTVQSMPPVQLTQAQPAQPAQPAQSTAPVSSAGQQAPAALSATMPDTTMAPVLRGPGVQNPVTTNDNGSALTPPDLSLYEGQLAAMQKLQRDNLELKLELEQAELKAKLRTVQNGGKPVGDDSASDAPVMPMVTNLTGAGDSRQALITMPGYGQMTVRAGDALPNHWKVVEIDDGGVVVTDGKARNAKRVRLPFATGTGGAA